LKIPEFEFNRLKVRCHELEQKISIQFATIESLRSPSLSSTNSNLNHHSSPFIEDLLQEINILKSSLLNVAQERDHLLKLNLNSASTPTSKSSNSASTFIFPSTGSCTQTPFHHDSEKSTSLQTQDMFAKQRASQLEDQLHQFVLLCQRQESELAALSATVRMQFETMHVLSTRLNDKEQEIANAKYQLESVIAAQNKLHSQLSRVESYHLQFILPQALSLPADSEQ
jgi:uncharacterized coiled-coil protein SlyX